VSALAQSILCDFCAKAKSGETRAKQKTRKRLGTCLQGCIAVP
jgi:hypothetical protein